ncbi:MAG: citramalate synthase [Terrimicrobiaceae bacterium]|nr:citramalate synthase [Terrimicrobiaceae bacterium]
MQKSVQLYDTTLRDGTQGTGISFSVQDKIRVAERLDAFGIDYIEGGFPGSNPKDAEFFKEAARREWKHAKVAAFGATRRGNMAVEADPQLRVLLEAETPVITIVGKTWPIQVTEVLGVTLEENLAMIAETVAYLKKHGREVFYDAEHFFDSYRSDPAYSLATLKAAHEAGANLVVLCDTNGGSLPEFVAGATRDALAALGVPVGIHTHNDCGLGVANALAAIAAGAVQVQGTINGYGERAGNCDLVTVSANLQLKLGIPVVADLTPLRELSLFVDELANVPPNIRAPYVGSAAFTHKGGQHVHAVQKLSSSYEHVDPARVGNRQTIVVSDLSGQSNVLAKARELGFALEKGGPDAAKTLAEVKRLENEGYEFEAADASFDLLVRKLLGVWKPLFDLKEYHCHFRYVAPSGATAAAGNPCEATVKLLVDGTPEYVVAEGDGPVNALDAALRKALRPFYAWIDDVALTDYKVRIVDGRAGTAARTRVLIESTDGHRSWGTVGVSDNIIEASWQALVDSFEFYRNAVAERGL